MTFIKTPYFRVSTTGSISLVQCRDAIGQVVTSLGLSITSLVNNSSNHPAISFALPFSNADRGTVYPRISISGTSFYRVFHQINADNLANNVNPTGGTTPGFETPVWNELIRVEDELREFYGYYRPNEGLIIGSRSPGKFHQFIYIFSPEGKFADWDENLFPHVFTTWGTANGSSPDGSSPNAFTLFGFYRGVTPNLFNPFPGTTSATSSNVIVQTSQLFTNFNRNPANEYDIYTAPYAQWTGFTNYGLVGRFSEFIGFCPAGNLRPETQIVRSPTEIWEVVDVGTSLALVVRVV